MPKSIYISISALLILSVFAVTGLVGLFSIDEYNYLPVKQIFLAMFLLFYLRSLTAIQKNSLPIATVLAAYLLSTLLIAIASNSIHLADYLLAYISFYYMFMLLFIANIKLLSVKIFDKLLTFLLIVFLIKYSYSVALNLTNRPGLWIENNFELLLLSLLFVGKSFHSKQGMLVDSVLLSSIFLLSGSRSAVAILAFTFIFLKIDLKYFKLKNAPYIVIIPFILFFGYQAIISRMPSGGIESIDRFKFLLLFYAETKSWGLWEYLFGTATLTPLSNVTCNALSYYTPLFSAKNDGSCYSVIFHSFILRLLFDHGLSGLFFTIYFLHKILSSAGYSIRYIFIILGIFFLNGISVSSLNSIFGALGLMLLITIGKDQKNA